MKQYFAAIVICMMPFTQINAQWQETSLRVDMNSNAGITKLYYDNDILWAGSLNKVYKSDDKGNSWSDVTSGGISVPQTSVKDIIKLGNYVYVAFGGNGNKQIYRTNDNGQTWSLDTAGHSQFQHVINFYKHQDYVLAKLETNFTLFKKNTDTAWRTLNVPESRFVTPQTIFSKGDTLILTTGMPGPAMALTTDMGQTWTVRETNWGTALPANGDWTFGVWHGKNNPLQMMGIHRGFTTTPPLEYIYHFVRSYDGMETFDTCSFNSSGLVTMWLDNNDVYAGFQRSNNTLDNRIQKSTDKGQSWTDITGNILDFVQFKHLPIATIEVIDGVAFVGGNQNGVLRNGNTVGITKKQKTGLNFKVYPNPGFESIHLHNVVKGSLVAIYNTLGQCVQQFETVQDNQNVDVSKLNVGVYFIKCISKDKAIGHVQFMKQ